MTSLGPRTLLLVLLVLLAVGTGQAVDVNWLTNIVNRLLTEYGFKDQICMMANIPESTQPDDLISNLGNVHYDTVLGVIGRRTNAGVSAVYEDTNTNLVVARPNEDGHAEQRAVGRVASLHHNQQQAGNTFLMYSYLSPCGDQCANPGGDDNILTPLREQVMPRWSQRILVFNTVFNQPRSGGAITRQTVQTALQQLQGAGFGENIFRCCGPTWGAFECHKCFSGDQVNNICLDNNASPGWQGGSDPPGGGSDPPGGGSDPPGGQEPSQGKRPHGGSSPTGGDKRPRGP